MKLRVCVWAAVLYPLSAFPDVMDRNYETQETNWIITEEKSSTFMGGSFPWCKPL
jgi:hypothetical protein